MTSAVTVKTPKVAFVHEWLAVRGGSEKVLEAALELWPDAPIFTMVHDPQHYTRSPIASREVRTSFIQKLPFGRTRYRAYLPFMPWAVEQFDLSTYDIVISSNHAVAKGVITRADQLHVSYVHTPTRYAWALQHQYLAESGLRRGPRSLVARLVLHYLRLWDVLSAARVDAFVANSAYVAKRIAKSWRREATVIHPPVDVERFRPDRPREDFFLTVSRLVPYKQVGLIVEAFNRLGLPLVVIGGGPGLARIRALAKPNVRVLGEQDDAAVADHLERCRAFVFAADEDFGITPVEAQAAGAPVIAYGRGGALETVQGGETGRFFPEQTVDSLAQAVEAFQGSPPPAAAACHANARRFTKRRFQDEFKAFVEREWAEFSR